ncbi:hypothetical protein H4R18_005615 [Coemansia javaensis]|uniref:Mtf2-like C-terminal domain-containing protein n=1 Tax=Coemansia javaensis TaxID=2761396 RepID=A0A9W8LF30_9FUNG|nr:hypothetical protein H4R18_005615 [Coemansia javaensis]
MSMLGRAAVRAAFRAPACCARRRLHGSGARALPSGRHGDGDGDGADDDGVQDLESIFDALEYGDRRNTPISNNAGRRAGPVPAQSGSKSDRAAADGDDDVQSLESILALLDQQESESSAAASSPPKQPQPQGGKEPWGGAADGQDPHLADIMAAIDQNRSLGGESSSAQQDAGEAADDPMREFERILADLASSDTRAYKREKPAPLFWDEDAIDKEYGSKDSFLKNLGPGMLFRSGPRASAYSAGRLVGDSDRVSAIAARVQRISQGAKKRGGSKAAGAEDTRGGQRQAKLDRDLEQNQLSKLAYCRSVPVLLGFVFSDLVSRSTTLDKSMAAARPSPAVYAEVIRKARELGAPSIGYFVYNYCRTRMRLANRLRVLNHEVCSEMLAAAWEGQRDISTVFLVIQDVVAMGVSGGQDMDRQISQIAAELRMVYNMPAAADSVLALQAKISPAPGAAPNAGRTPRARG